MRCLSPHESWGNHVFRDVLMCFSRTAGDIKAPGEHHLREPHRRSGRGPSIRGVPPPRQLTPRIVRFFNGLPRLKFHGGIGNASRARCNLPPYVCAACCMLARPQVACSRNVRRALPSEAAAAAALVLPTKTAAPATTVVLPSSRL